MKLRKPTAEEKRELAKYLVEEFDLELEDISRSIKNSVAAVFDDHVTFYPAYVYKVMMIVWEVGPSIFDVFTREDGQIKQEERG